MVGQKIHAYGIKRYAVNVEGLNKNMQISLNYNGLSRARWHQHLGMQKSRFFIKSLKSLRNNGGIVPMIDVIVIKKFPLV